MNIQELVRENYRTNPAFAPYPISLNINPELENAFKSQYGNPKEFKDAGELGRILEVCLSLTSEIFLDLTNQVEDQVHKKFFYYLNEAVRSFLEEEFELRKLVQRKYSEKSLESKNERVAQLDNASFFYGKISENATDRIIKMSNETLKGFRRNVSEGKVSRIDLSLNHGDLIREIGWILDKEFRKSGVFEAVSEFMCISYDHVGLSLELSTEKSTWWKNKLSNSEPPKTMYAHLDEAYFAPKSIVYLSDVQELSGPTSCYPGIYKSIANNPLQDIVGRVIGTVSSKPELTDYYKSEYHQAFSSENFRRHFMSIPESIRFNSHFGWDVLPNSELESLLVEGEKVMLGTSGDYIVFDGAQLLHRGGLIAKGERVVMQVVFYPKTTIPLSTKVKWKAKQIIRGI